MQNKIDKITNLSFFKETHNCTEVYSEETEDFIFFSDATDKNQAEFNYLISKADAKENLQTIEEKLQKQYQEKQKIKEFNHKQDALIKKIDHLLNKLKPSETQENKKACKSCH